MSEFDEMLSGILNDPAQMKKIMEAANSLMNGAEPPVSPEGNDKKDRSDLSGLSNALPGDMMSAVRKLMGGGGSGPAGDKAALFRAMKPWMSEERSAKLDKAVKLVAALRVARIFLKKTEADLL